MKNIVTGSSGLLGSASKRQLVEVPGVEERDHIAGNCYTEEKDGINIHK